VRLQRDGGGHGQRGGDQGAERFGLQQTAGPETVPQGTGIFEQAQVQSAAGPVRPVDGHCPAQVGNDMFRHGETEHHPAGRAAQHRAAADVHVSADRQTDRARYVHDTIVTVNDNSVCKT